MPGKRRVSLIQLSCDLKNDSRDLESGEYSFEFTAAGTDARKRLKELYRTDRDIIEKWVMVEGGSDAKMRIDLSESPKVAVSLEYMKASETKAKDFLKSELRKMEEKLTPRMRDIIDR